MKTIEKKFLPAVLTDTTKRPRLYDGGGDTSKRWYIVYYVGTKRKRLYDELNSIADLRARYAHAQRLLDDLHARFKRQPLALQPAIIQDFMRVIDDKALALRKKSYQTYVSKVRHLAAWMRLRGVERLDSRSVKDFFKFLLENKRSRTTYNAYVQLFRSLHKQAYPTALNPFKGVQKLRADCSAARYFEPTQIAMLKAAMKQDPQLWLFVQFIYYCFIRPGELRQLKIGDILFDRAQISIRGEIAKNHRHQYVRIPKAFIPTFYEYRLHEWPEDYYVFSTLEHPAHKPVGINYFGNRHRALLQSLRFAKQHKLYSWKHSGVVAAVRAGIHIKQLQLQLRHFSLDQVNDYLSDLGVRDTEELGERFPAI